MLRFLSSNSAFNTFKNTEDNKMKNKLNLNFFLFLKSCFVQFMQEMGEIVWVFEVRFETAC